MSDSFVSVQERVILANVKRVGGCLIVHFFVKQVAVKCCG